MRTTGETFTPYHYTSANCMTLFRKYAKPGCSVLDVGTGSGVLAIKAKEAGAGRVLAVDVLESAIEDAKFNAEQAGVDVDVRWGYLNWEIGEKFDITIANLYPQQAEDFLQYAGNTMTDDGILILTWNKKVSYFFIEEYFDIVDCIGGEENFPSYVLRRKKK